MSRIVSRLVVLVLLIFGVGRVRAESYAGLDKATYFRFGMGGTHSPCGENFAEETTLAVSLMLDTEAATITYDSVVFSTGEIVILLEDNYTVDFGETVPITTTISLAPIVLASKNHNAFQLTPKLDGRFDIDHDRLRFDDSIIVTGRYDISGPMESAFHDFSVLYEMPNNSYLFPWMCVDTTFFPAELTLETWKQNPIVYYDYPRDSEFSARVDGADVTVDLQWLSLRLDNDLQVTSVPEPCGFILLSMAAVVGLGYDWRRRRRRSS